jgi:hypothetical protein
MNESPYKSTLSQSLYRVIISLRSKVELFCCTVTDSVFIIRVWGIKTETCLQFLEFLCPAHSTVDRQIPELSEVLLSLALTSWNRPLSLFPSRNNGSLIRRLCGTANIVSKNPWYYSEGKLNAKERNSDSVLRVKHYFFGACVTRGLLLYKNIYYLYLNAATSGKYSGLMGME